ncbi:MAG: UDP-N-acetylmuramoyl-L-alanine--D-glutamate ligase, partial [Treponemataceae bacterium]|nr:UDP-N-acetylmuramoyl-L-alanine--D-glutamate ligase [Treponemataceae bacterium]
AGTATDKMLADFAAHGISHNGVYQTSDERRAKLNADSSAHKGARGTKVVVFSPGATSFGMFQNEFDRGRQFKEKVRNLFR